MTRTGARSSSGQSMAHAHEWQRHFEFAYAMTYIVRNDPLIGRQSRGSDISTRPCVEEEET